MSIIQRRNDEDASLHGADQLQNAFEYLHEPLGDFGVWNGQFEIGSQRTGDIRPEGWEVNADAGGFVMRAPGGACGNWCMMGGRVGVGTGGNIVSLRYIPVYCVSQAGRDYYIACAFISNLGVGDARLGVHCYTAAKAFIATVWAVSVANVPVAWTWYQRKVGPNGNVAFPAGTRYIRVVVGLQYDAGVEDIICVDDVQFQQMKMAYSPGIRLMDGVIRDTTARDFTLAAWTQHPNSTITLTLEEPGYIWFQYYCYGYNGTATRTASVSVQVFIGGVAQATFLNCGSTLNHRMSWTLANRSDGVLAAGAYNVDLRVYVVNAGDAVTISALSGAAFYTRAW